MTYPHVLKLSLPCLVLALTFCAGNSSQKEEHRSALVANDAIVRAQARNLVDVRAVLPDVVCDLRYATRENITKQVLYPKDMPCLLYASTAEKLRKAQATLRSQGYGLKIWDGWRPPEVQKALFEHGGYTGMFTDPSITWSRHCSGTAVDVTLVDDKGRELEMPTKFDAGGPGCHYLAILKSEAVRQRRHALQMAMLQAGFSILDAEWWHFDDTDFDGTRPVPPAIFAGEIGIPLPKVKEPRVKRGGPTYSTR
jgi:D-alanyl-D-alanine dipeptidase